MSGMERIYQIDQILAGRKFVPRKELQERLGVSWATLKRDLAYLKDRLRILVKLATNNASKLAGDNASTCPLQKELQAES